MLWWTRVNAWDFADGFPRERRAALLAPTTFEAIVERFVNEMTILCVHIPVCEDGPQEDGKPTHGRFLGCVGVKPDVCDLFFNSPNGYRGAYYRSPEMGQEANACSYGGYRHSS